MATKQRSIKMIHCIARFAIATIIFSQVCVSAFGQFAQPATTVQLPVLGVSVDANGQLTTNSIIDPTGELIRQRIAAIEHRLPKNIAKPSKLRKISLRRLDKVIAEYVENGRPLPEQINYLAGLQRIQFVFIDVSNNDIIIAGPAEGWVDNGAGRQVGWQNRSPVLQLDDLLTALRVFGPDAHIDHWVGCTINPDPDGVKKLDQFNRDFPHEIPQNQKLQAAIQKAKGMRDSLGNANIQIFGLDSKSHLGQVLVEADYRMKLMGVGLEEPPFKMATFFGGLRGQPPTAFQSWWLVPDYKCVRLAPDMKAMELVGQGVKLSTANMIPGGNNNAAKLATKNLPKPHRAATRYANEFTENFEKIAAFRPVYAQLRQAIDCLIAAAFLKKCDAFNSIDWTPTVLLNESKLPVNKLNEPKHVPCVANSKWERHVLVAIAGGGVSIRASEALHESNLIKDGYDKLDATRNEVLESDANDAWWWD
jgi:hypothetical protein